MSKQKEGVLSCGECLWNRTGVVNLDERGVCPKCGTNYGTEIVRPQQPPLDPVEPLDLEPEDERLREAKALTVRMAHRIKELETELERARLRIYVLKGAAERDNDG